MHPSQKQTRLRVAICGAGIGGLTLALALSEYQDIEVEVFEAAKQLAEVGAGVGLFSRPWKVLQMLGLDQELLATTDTKPRDGPVSSFHYRKSNQPVGFQFSTLVTKGSLILLHRADFQSVILRHIPKSCRIHTSKRLRTFSQRQAGPIQLVFEDGTTTTCDVLVGADGVKSATRATMLGERVEWMRSQGREQEAADTALCIAPAWSGQVAYRTLIPVERLRVAAPRHEALTTPMQYLGKGGFVITYPVQQGKMINFAAFTFRHDLEGTQFPGPWVGPGERSKFAHVFADWEDDVQVLINCVDKTLAWAVHTVRPLRSFVSGRVALIGDAAHAMPPHQGSGAGQAIEDAYLLSRILGHPSTTPSTIARALTIHDSIRRPLSHRVAQSCRQAGRYFSFELDPSEVMPRVDLASDFGIPRRDSDEWECLQRLHANMVRIWEWAWTTSVDDSIQEAQRFLEAL
uniref:FAD-binding domain-containing protein n=1 Tax=Mycena chlorophos TaxID=658473 RepID=A0ABQ0L237_MYCCL|nr:predicted protein [Mycena chlorophos]